MRITLLGALVIGAVVLLLLFLRSQLGGTKDASRPS